MKKHTIPLLIFVALFTSIAQASTMTYHNNTGVNIAIDFYTASRESTFAKNGFHHGEYPTGVYTENKGGWCFHHLEVRPLPPYNKNIAGTVYPRPYGTGCGNWEIDINLDKYGNQLIVTEHD